MLANCEARKFLSSWVVTLHRVSLWSNRSIARLSTRLRVYVGKFYYTSKWVTWRLLVLSRYHASGVNKRMRNWLYVVIENKMEPEQIARTTWTRSRAGSRYNALRLFPRERKVGSNAAECGSRELQTRNQLAHAFFLPVSNVFPIWFVPCLFSFRFFSTLFFPTIHSFECFDNESSSRVSF